MPSAIGFVVVNVKNGKKSKILLKDPYGRFKSSAKVHALVSDKDNPGVVNDFTAESKRKDSTLLIVRLTGNGHNPRPGGGADDPPDSGTLVITVDNGPTVDDVPVDYVDDDEVP